MTVTAVVTTATTPRATAATILLNANTHTHTDRHAHAHDHIQTQHTIDQHARTCLATGAKAAADPARAAKTARSFMVRFGVMCVAATMRELVSLIIATNGSVCVWLCVAGWYQVAVRRIFSIEVESRDPPDEGRAIR